jgi:hypothetical protein
LRRENIPSKPARVTDQKYLRRIVKRLRSFAQAPGNNRHAIAVSVGLDPGTLKTMHDLDWNPTLSTLDKLTALLPRTRRRA